MKSIAFVALGEGTGTIQNKDIIAGLLTSERIFWSPNSNGYPTLVSIRSN